MCPICWTTAMASFAVLITVSALVTIGSDKWCLLLTPLLMLLVMLHRIGAIQTAWWCFASLIMAIAIRVLWILVKHPDQTLIMSVWKRAVAIASNRCSRSAAEGPLPLSNEQPRVV